MPVIFLFYSHLFLPLTARCCFPHPPSSTPRQIKGGKNNDDEPKYPCHTFHASTQERCDKVSFYLCNVGKGPNAYTKCTYTNTWDSDSGICDFCITSYLT